MPVKHVIESRGEDTRQVPAHSRTGTDRNDEPHCNMSFDLRMSLMTGIPTRDMVGTSDSSQYTTQTSTDGSVGNFGALNNQMEGSLPLPTRLSSRGSRLYLRFKRFGHLSDINNAVLNQQDAVALTPEGDINRAVRLHNLGLYLTTRFERLGQLADIDKGISYLQDAIYLTPDWHPGKPNYLVNLGTALMNRYERLGDLPDIDEAIRLQQIGVLLTPDDHVDKFAYMNSLGFSLKTRFDRLRKLPDVDKAILTLQDALRRTPEEHDDKLRILNNLATSLMARFQHLREIPDIDKAIDLLQEAMKIAPEGHAVNHVILSNLGRSLKARYEHSGEFADVDKAINTLRTAANLTPEGHANTSWCFGNLGDALIRRFMYLKNWSDLKQGLDAYKRAANDKSSTPTLRLNVTLRWMKVGFRYDNGESGREALQLMLELIPQLVWLGQSFHRRLEVLSEIGDAVNEAAALAINKGNYSLAFESLDEGRSILWGQLLRLRTPIDDLRSTDSKLANDLEKTAHALEIPGNQADAIDNQALESTITSTNQEAEAQNRHSLAQKYESLIEKVRKLDGFEYFLRPKRLEDLKAAAENGPVAIVNVHKLRCDALILHLNGIVSHVNLSGFSYEEAMRMQVTLRSYMVNGRSRGHDRGMGISGSASKVAGVLHRLWSGVVKPVMQKLEEEDELYADSEDAVSRITWCTTGPLTFLPLHAAAAEAPKKSLYGPIISSYTPSVSALLRRQDRANASQSIPNVLAVSQPYTDGYSPLPATREEIKAMQNVIKVTWLDQEQADIASVSRAMETHDVVHLACHGIQDGQDPTKSAFILADGRFTLHDLMRMNLKDAQLAVLSACQTATGHEERPEEAMHLTAGMLSAGFRSVVGTMWSIRDDDAPIVADAFYSKLREYEISGMSWRTKTAYALYHAVQVLRDRIGDDEYLRWMPFVHFGR